MTDMVGSTEHAAEVGDRAWRDLVHAHNQLIRAALRRHRGREVDTAGDGFFATFDAPAAAVECALEIVRGIKDLGVDVRAGIHAGEVEQLGGKVGGIAVPIASRIMSLASGGEVFVSSTVRDLAAGAGLRFDDRGSRQLKGVPGDWQVFSVASSEAETAQADDDRQRAQRRAAAVRRERERPIWQRHPRATGATILSAVVLVAVAALLIVKPWQPPALARVTENSIGVIDISRGQIVREIRVGTRPGGIAAGEGGVWVTNTGADTVSQVDLETRAAVNRVDVGRGPIGVAVGDGSVWVANSGERTVTRINAATARVVQTIDVGNGPTALAAGPGSVWVANATDSTIIRIDAQSGAIGPPIGVAAKPIALALAENELWVASEDGASVTRLDPSTGVTLAAPIQLAARPTALALDPESVWVPAADGTLTRISRANNRILATVDIGGSLSGIAITDAWIWVGSRDGYVYRLDRANPTGPPLQIATESAPEALATISGDVWVAAQAAVASHRGGTLRVMLRFPAPDQLDPLGFLIYNATLLQADGLVGYRRVGGTSGSALLPDLAASLPQPANAGRTYTFQLRPDLTYSTGEPVRPADFRRAIERSFQIEIEPKFVIGSFFFRHVVGAEACLTDDGSAVERCDLSSGIVVDDAVNTVTFHLSEPDPNFLYKLAMPYAYPVPEGVPMNGLIDGAFPGTGPYTIASATETELRMIRNPNFRVWNAEVRPDGFPDEIVWIFGLDQAEQIARIERGEADFMISGGPNRMTPEQFARVRTQFPGQLRFGSVVTQWLALNKARPPFDSLEARQALSFGIDRHQIADMYGGPPAVAITCQFLPPTWPGYLPYCPYTASPDAGGRWRAPDMVAAQQLVDASGTRGQSIEIGPVSEQHVRLRDYLASLLAELGYDVSVDESTDQEHVFQAFRSGEMQLAVSGWIPDFLAPSTFFERLTCVHESEPFAYCDPSFDALYNDALDLQMTDAAAAAAKWAEVDREAVDRALTVPLFNEGSDFLAARVGNYQFNPAYQVLIDQLWVQ